MGGEFLNKPVGIEGVWKQEEKETEGKRIREGARQGEKQPSERRGGRMGTEREHTEG